MGKIIAVLIDGRLVRSYPGGRYQDVWITPGPSISTAGLTNANDPLFLQHARGQARSSAPRNVHGHFDHGANCWSRCPSPSTRITTSWFRRNQWILLWRRLVTLARRRRSLPRARRVSSSPTPPGRTARPLALRTAISHLDLGITTLGTLTPRPGRRYVLTALGYSERTEAVAAAHSADPRPSLRRIAILTERLRRVSTS